MLLTIIAIVASILIVAGLVTALIIEVKNDNKKHEEYKELFNVKELGICNTCEYGFDNCLKDGKAKCLKEEQNGKKKSF